MSQTGEINQPPNDEDRHQKIIASHAVQLGEHFDSVQIICTRYDGVSGQSYKASAQYGNWYTNYGAAREWVAEKDQELRDRTRHSNE